MSAIAQFYLEIFKIIQFGINPVIATSSFGYKRITFSIKSTFNMQKVVPRSVVTQFVISNENWFCNWYSRTVRNFRQFSAIPRIKLGISEKNKGAPSARGTNLEIACVAQTLYMGVDTPINIYIFWEYNIYTELFWV